MKIQFKIEMFPVADPGFPVVGGVDLVGGAWTPEAATFRKICMSKRKNWVPKESANGSPCMKKVKIITLNMML